MERKIKYKTQKNICIYSNEMEEEEEQTKEMRSFTLFIRSFARSLVRSFCLTTPSHVSWINFFLSHAHILTRAFFYYSILFLGIVCVFDFHRFDIFFVFSRRTGIQMNLCMQHPSYFCSSSSRAHIRKMTKENKTATSTKKCYKKMTFRL